MPRVACGTTTRIGGVSETPWSSFNTALHAGDDPAHVMRNRELLKRHIGAESLQFLDQVHGVDVVRVGRNTTSRVPTADAMWTDEAGIALIIQTADCLPVMFASRDDSVVGAAHAGWRGVACNVVQALLKSLPVAPRELSVWMGPAITGRNYEVGDDVREAMNLVVPNSVLDTACAPSAIPGKWWLDLVPIVTWQLESEGVDSNAITASGLCTFGEPERFYSYRREGRTGRLASFILLNT